MTGVLPAYVTWLGNASSDVTYNENDRTITWAVGDMNAAASRSVTYQISLTPSLTQIGVPPSLVTQETITAFDRFIRAPVERPQLDITTETSASFDKGVVVP